MKQIMLLKPIGKRGDVDTLYWLLIGFVLIVALIAIKLFWTLSYTELQKSSLYTSDADSKSILDKVNNGTFPLFDSFFMIFAVGIMFATLILAYALRTTPLFIPVMIVFTGVEVLVASFLSNVFEKFITTPVLADTANTFTMTIFFFQYLPYWVLLFNVAVGVVMFGLGRSE